MRKGDKETAQRFGIYEKCKSLESDLLKIKGIAFEKKYDGICFDLSGFYSNIKQVIIIPRYDIIGVTQKHYFAQRRAMLNKIIEVCEQHGLTSSGDVIEDYGAHYYIVRNCNWEIVSSAH